MRNQFFLAVLFIFFASVPGAVASSTDAALLATLQRSNLSHSDIESIRAMLQRGANPDARDSTGMTALMLVISNAHDYSIKTGLMDLLVLEYFADVEARDQEGRTALMIAAGLESHTRDSADIVDKLIGWFAAINDKDRGGKSALMFAAERDNVEVMEILLEHGADLDYATRGSYAVDEEELEGVSSEEQFEDIIAIGLGGEVKNKNVFRKSGKTALMFAVEWRAVEAVRLLLDYGADVDHAEDELGRTALLIAAEEGYREIVELLVKAGASLSETDRLGRTAHALAEANNHFSTAHLLREAQESQRKH